MPTIPASPVGPGAADYNDILYPTYLASQCSPDRFAVMARMKGLETAPPDRCRMLELGCGDGASLIAFGYALPDSEFVGVDLAARPIEIGNARIASLGLKNVTLHCADVMQVNDSIGMFDFILAHGLFSWVPEPVRERVLEICGALINPKGVAYLSYNAYPGSYQRDMLRAMLQMHTRHLTDPSAKIRQSLGLIDFIRSAPFRGSPYHQFIEGFHETRGNPEVLLYDELGSINQPFFFHEFAQMAARHGLEYLNEADFDPTLAALPAKARKTLDGLGNNPVAFEQYLDFLTGRAFRQTMLCRHGVELDRRRRWEPLAGLYFASPIEREELKESDAHEGRRYLGMRGRSALVGDPIVQKALEHLGAAWPASVSFHDLAAAGGAVDEAGLEVLGQNLLQLTEANFLKLHAHPFRLAAGISERPRASALARLQIGERFLANLFCEAVATPDPLGGLVLERLDGTRTKPELIAELSAVLDAQRPETDEARRQLAEARAHLDEALDKKLRDIRGLGLLEA